MTLILVLVLLVGAVYAYSKYKTTVKADVTEVEAEVSGVEAKVKKIL